MTSAPLPDDKRRGAGPARILVATHSPVVAAVPGARILEVGDHGLRDTTWDDLDLVAHHRTFLDNPGAYLRHVID